MLKYVVEKPWVNMCCVYDDTTCEGVTSHFYNLERLHVVGIHNTCEEKFKSLAVGVVLVLIVVVPLMNNESLPNFRAWVKCAYTLDNRLCNRTLSLQ